jgi:hypothetical protein
VGGVSAAPAAASSPAPARGGVVSLLSPQLDVCWRNPFLAGVSEEAVWAHEEYYAAWWQQRSAALYRLLTHFYYHEAVHPEEPVKDSSDQLARGRVGDEILQIIYDPTRPWPCPYGPNGEHHVERLHKEGEAPSEAKQLCAISKYTELVERQRKRWPEMYAADDDATGSASTSASSSVPTSPSASSSPVVSAESFSSASQCIVYSLGSNNQFGFEEVVSTTTPCTTWTFDCTSSPPTTAIARLHFEAACLGPEEFNDSGQNLQLRMFPMMHTPPGWLTQSFKPVLEKVKYTTYSKIVDSKLRHSHVSLLKIDIEGGEYATLIDMLADEQRSRTRAPFQIAIETHWSTYRNKHTHTHTKRCMSTDPDSVYASLSCACCCVVGGRAALLTQC